MIKEQQHAIADELQDIDFYSNYGMTNTTGSPMPVEYTVMQELADCFVGFATEPVCVFNHKLAEIKTYEFQSIDEIKDAVLANKEANVEMILFYIAPTKTGAFIRMAEV